MEIKNILKTRKLPAITLIEVILAVAVMAMISVAMLPIGQQYLQRNEFESATLMVAQGVRNAEANAKSGNGDTTWGVRISGSTITVFKGATYATRDTTYDIVSTWSNKITASGLSEIVFSRLEAVPSVNGNITLTGYNQSKTITLNAKGNVLY